MNVHITGFAMAFAVWGKFVDEIVTDFASGDQHVNAEIIHQIVAGEVAGLLERWIAVSWSSW